jgi:ATP-dependent DNA helicase RecG
LPGVPDPASVIARVHLVTRDLRDLGRYETAVLRVADRSVVEVRVHRRVNGFAQLSNGQVLVRRGEHDVPLFGADLVTFVMSRQFQRFESHALDVTLHDADEGAVDALVDALGWHPDEDNVVARLRERGLLDASGAALTVAGALFLAPGQDALGKAYVEVRRYPDDGNVYDKRSTIRGPLQEQIRTATRSVLDEIGTDFLVSGAYRYELPKLPTEVVREAVANAVAHRSYETTGTPTVIEVRPGRVVVRSPGGLPEGVTVDRLRDAQSARNTIVIDVLRRFGVAEDAGRGVDVMQDRMAEALLDPPRFADLGHAFEVTLPVHSAISPEERAWVLAIERQGEIAPGDRLLLVHAARGDRLTNAVARAVLGVDSTAARSSLRRLCEADLLHQRGTRGGATYALGPRIRPPVATRRTPEQVEQAVVDHAAREPLTNAMVREITGLDRARALALLDRLVRQGRLRRVGEKRGTKYEAG